MTAIVSADIGYGVIIKLVCLIKKSLTTCLREHSFNPPISSYQNLIL